MPNFKETLFSIVFIGRFNPQILNHDFLVNNKILPEKEEPFKALFAKEDNKPFTEFMSTPVLTTIKYDSINIVIEESRFQIQDLNNTDPSTSPIVSITKKYFGEILKYTPISAGGINLNGIITFTDADDEQRFNETIGISKDWQELDLLSIHGADTVPNGSSQWLSSVKRPDLSPPSVWDTSGENDILVVG